MKNFKLSGAMLAAGVLLSCGASDARWARVTEPVPTERLITNISDYVQKNPKDAHGYYVLGRVHSLASVTTEENIEIVPVGKGNNEDKNLPGFAPYQTVRVTNNDNATTLNAAQLKHLSQSVWNYTRATQFDSKNALYFLGLGWMLEQGAPFAAQAGASWPEPLVASDAKGRKTQKRIRGFIGQLGSSTPAKSQRAFGELEKLQPSATVLLKAYSDEKSNAAAREKIAVLLTSLWRRNSLAAYRNAYALHIEEETKSAGTFMGGDNAIALEAGQGILRLFNLKAGVLSEAEKAEKAGVEKSIEMIEAKPHAVTPILIPLGEKTSLNEILAPKNTVSFDLAGDGRGARWNWVMPDAGILVYDPENSGRITSGRQLFGNATWWMFFRDGYEAMSALDDNGNGWLEGKELNGLAIWRDANGNGVSDAGEVLALRACGIDALAVRAADHNGKTLLNAHGCRMSDGSFRPTYDWIAEPVIP